MVVCSDSHARGYNSASKFIMIAYSSQWLEKVETVLLVVILR